MATTVASANMSLPVPVVGVDLGPQYAIDINTCLGLIDSHNHSSGQGTAISQAGISISGDFALNGYNATLVRTVRFSSQGAVLSLPTDLICAYAVGNDLYFNDGLGNQIRMTQSGSIAGTTGSIAGLTSPASATYVPASSKFIWQSAVNTPATMDMGNIIVRNNTASANGVTIAPVNALASSYSLTLFPSLPSVKKVVSVDPSGNMTADVYSGPSDLDNYAITATVASNALTVALKTLAGTDPSATDITLMSFRSATAGTGTYTQRTITGALSLVVPSTATLGTTSAVASYLYVYALDNGGTVELAISSTLFDTTVVQSTTTIAAGSNTSSVMYSTTGRSNVPVRLIGKLLSTQTVAGTWAAVPSQITLNPVVKDPVNYAISSSSGTFSSTATSYTDVTNLTVTITTTGRPVYIALVPDTALVSGAYIGANITTGTTLNINLQIVRNGSPIFIFSAGTQPAASGTFLSNWPASSVACLDTPAAGTYTYKLQINGVASQTMRVYQTRLIAFEL